MNVRARIRLVVDVVWENKAFVLGPAITLVPQLFSLPLLISSFVCDCQNFGQWINILLHWQSPVARTTTTFTAMSTTRGQIKHKYWVNKEKNDGGSRCCLWCKFLGKRSASRMASDIESRSIESFISLLRGSRCTAKGKSNSLLLSLAERRCLMPC